MFATTGGAFIVGATICVCHDGEAKEESRCSLWGSTLVSMVVFCFDTVWGNLHNLNEGG